jgi:predicted XRE-type DNA-binding protein
MSDGEFASVWDAIEDTRAAAETMKLRSGLMMALKEHVEGSGLDEAQAAKALNVTAPRVADLMRGKINSFQLESLIAMASSAGLHVELHVAKPKAA